MKKNRKPQPISREYYESLKDAASYLDFALTELDGGDRYETMSTLLDARLMVLNVVPSQQFEELERGGGGGGGIRAAGRALRPSEGAAGEAERTLDER